LEFVSSLRSLIHLVPVPVVAYFFLSSGLDVDTMYDSLVWVKRAWSIQKFYYFFRPLVLTFISGSHLAQYDVIAMAHLLREIFSDYANRFFYRFNFKGFNSVNTVPTAISICNFSCRRNYRFLRRYVFNRTTFEYIIGIAVSCGVVWVGLKYDTIWKSIKGFIEKNKKVVWSSIKGFVEENKEVIWKSIKNFVEENNKGDSKIFRLLAYIIKDLEKASKDKSK